MLEDSGVDWPWKQMVELNTCQLRLPDFFDCLGRYGKFRNLCCGKELIQIHCVAFQCQMPLDFSPEGTALRPAVLTQADCDNPTLWGFFPRRSPAPSDSCQTGQESSKPRIQGRPVPRVFHATVTSPQSYRERKRQRRAYKT